MSELKACPFCGGVTIRMLYDEPGEVLGIRVPASWAWQCFGCGARGPASIEEKKAEAAWNTRPLEDALIADVERLVKMLAWSRQAIDGLLAAVLGKIGSEDGEAEVVEAAEEYMDASAKLGKEIAPEEDGK